MTAACVQDAMVLLCTACKLHSLACVQSRALSAQTLGQSGPSASDIQFLARKQELQIAEASRASLHPAGQPLPQQQQRTGSGHLLGAVNLVAVAAALAAALWGEQQALVLQRRQVRRAGTGCACRFCWTWADEGCQAAASSPSAEGCCWRDSRATRSSAHLVEGAEVLACYQTAIAVLRQAWCRKT